MNGAVKKKNNGSTMSKAELQIAIVRLRNEIMFGAAGNLPKARRLQKLEKQLSKLTAGSVRVRIFGGGAPGLKK